MMKKLYFVTKQIQTCFVVDEDDAPEDIERLARKYLKEEEHCGRPENFLSVPVEITDIKQLPEDWIEALPWGDSEETTVKEFLRLQKLKPFE